jgi:hypothetical protein
MTIKTLFGYMWKLPLCGMVFFFGMALGGILIPRLGLPSPAMPEGTDANSIALWFFLSSMILAFVLSFLSRNLQANPLLRWVILAELTWSIGIISIVMESFFFMTTGAVSTILNALYTVLSFSLPVLFLTIIVALLFPPEKPYESCLSILRSYLRDFKSSKFGWRVVLALSAYPLVYIVFGLMARPFVQAYYIIGQFELSLPTWSQLIALQLLRSGLFFLFSMPVLIWWRGTQRGLWLSLGFSLFILTAFMPILTAYWFPWQMRLFHGLELLADGLVYAGILVVLFGRERIKLPISGRAAHGLSAKVLGTRISRIRLRRTI